MRRRDAAEERNFGEGEPTADVGREKREATATGDEARR